MTAPEPILIGASGHGDQNTDYGTPRPFELEIPAGTTPGDLLVASIITFDTISLTAPGRGLDELYRHEGTGDWCYGVWAGLWDGDTTPIPWQGSGFLNATGQFFGAFLAAYRARLDPLRPIVVEPSPTIPGLDREGPALCVNWLRAGIGGVGGFHPFAGTTWTDSVLFDASYALGSCATNTGIIPDQTSTVTGALLLEYMTFGVIVSDTAPPCRLYPREDHLGVGSGRIWPPPKSQQASPRRAGGYY